MIEPAAVTRPPDANVDPVGEFYTRHPYPPPVENLDRARDEWRDVDRQRADFHLFWPHRPFRADLDILVAGCGTWQAAKYAICRPDSRVVGIDVSPTSIDHTEQLKGKYGLTNLDVRQWPIERVDALDQRFDLIVCTGVLHHLADPDAGLRALASVLKPRGAISLMVYAPYGRAGVYMLQDYCRRLRIGTTEQEIDDLIMTLAAMPQSHPLAAVLRGARDAASPDALADALLNPRDRAYSVPQVFDLLDRTGLTFGRWYRQAPYLAQCGTIAKTPHVGRLAALLPRDEFAALELLRGTMTAHSVIAYSSDDEVRPMSIKGDGWHGYVPIRLPWTQLIQEHLAPGVTGVLINRSHQYHDLVLTLDGAAQRLFDGIDGRRTIGEILADARDIDVEQARAFFESLWRYDQIVFDAAK